jgi:hypothetical protein
MHRSQAQQERPEYRVKLKRGDLKLAHPGGRPPKYTDNDINEVQRLIDQYFIDCEGKPIMVKDPETDDEVPYLDKYSQPVMIGVKPATVTGLCLALGFTTRQALINYEDDNRDNPKLVDAITRAKLKCHEYAERRLYDKDGANGAKFSLANNFGWVDRQEIIQHNDIFLPESPEERRTRIAELLSKKQLESAIPVDYEVIPDK